MRLRASILLATVPVLACAAGSAEAHAFLRRYDLPLPLWHYLAGAGLAVALTFVLLAVFARGANPGARRVELALPALGRALDAPYLRDALAALSLAVFVLLIAAGLAGAQDDPFRNILPSAIWVGWWVGLAFVCALIGNVWPTVNPWRAAARLARWRGGSAPMDKLDAWPAVALFWLFAWMELAWTDNAVPRLLAGAILVYSAITWIGMWRFGTESWTRHADPFSQVFDLFGRVAPLGRRDDGRLVLRPFGAGLSQGEAVSTSRAALIVVLLSTVSYDGFLHTPPWRRWFGWAFDAAYDAGLIGALGNVGARTLIVTAGLIAAPIFFLAVLAAVSWLMALLGRGADGAGPAPGEIARRIAPSLIPIAVAYHLSHYLSLLLIEGQRLYALPSDPFGRGWNLFGTAGLEPDIAAADARFLWLFSVAAIVLGHAVAVWIGHRAALDLYRGRRRVFVAQLPMLVLMVAYTMLSLWILAQPIVEA